MRIRGKTYILGTSFLTFILVFLLIFTPTFSPASQSIQVKGSDTEVNVVQRMAEIYMQENRGLTVAVTGGGSGVGIAAIINGTTDLANSSRPMRDEELARARVNGVDPVGIVFALDGLSVIINPANTVRSLTLDQIGKIYRGEVTNWIQVGGPEQSITLYGRQPNSGTFMFFRQLAVRGDYAHSMYQMNGSAQIMEAVRRDRGGIGYVGIGYVAKNGGSVRPGIKVLDVARDVRRRAVSPLRAENIVSGAYPLLRPLYQYLNRANRPQVEAFIKFELSAEGQKIIVEEGFYPVSEAYRKHNARYGF